MSALGQFLDSILSVFVMVINLVISFVQGIAQMVVMIPQALGMLTYSVSSLPPVLVVFATAFISVSVVYLVIGR